MVIKLYTLAWITAVGAAAAFYFIGDLNHITLTVFGVVFSTLFFGFFVAVLPWLMDKHYGWEYRS